MTQNEAILRRLRNGEVLTPLEALNDPEIRAMRLSERIREIEKHGYEIEHLRVKTPTNKTVAGYLLKTDIDENGQRFMRMGG